MKKHWIFHKYKWTTDTTQIAYSRGLFSDDFGEVRYQTGECECGAIKMREIYLSESKLDWEMKEPLIKYQIDVAKRLEKLGRHNDAIEILKIRF